MVTKPDNTTVLLTGATGFIGSSLYPELDRSGYDILCATRNPERARENNPSQEWIKFDVHDPESVNRALEKSDVIYYLIHEMSTGEGYRERERQAATNVRDAAEDHEINRIIYLGGIKPDEEPSKHLKSRLETGKILREGSVPGFELRASMIIGPGSASWKIVRDLAARLPVMILPKWTQSRSEPVYIGDVVKALLGALDLDPEEQGSYDLPGPEALTVEEILTITANLLDNNPWNIRVPLLSPKLSSWWLRFVTRGDLYLAQELVEGLKSDILAEDKEYWNRINHPNRVPFRDAASITLRQTDEVSFMANFYEQSIKLLSSTQKQPNP